MKEFTYLLKAGTNVQCGVIAASTKEKAEKILKRTYNDGNFYSVIIL